MHLSIGNGFRAEGLGTLMLKKKLVEEKMTKVSKDSETYKLKFGLMRFQGTELHQSALAQ